MKTKDLKGLVRGLSHVKLIKDVAILGCVLIERVSGKLKARVSNLEEHLSGVIVSDGPDFSCFVEAKSFFSVVKALRSENCSVSFDPEKSNLVIAGDELFKISCKDFSVGDFVTEPKRTKRIFTVTCGKKLLTAIEKKFSFATKKSGGMYECILFNPLDKGTEVVSTDLWRLVKGTFGFMTPDAVSLPVLAIKRACKIFRDFSEFYVSNISRNSSPSFRAFFVSEVFTYSIMVVPYGWPDYASVFCSKNSNAVTVDRKELQETMEQVIAVSSEANNPTVFNFNEAIGKLVIRKGDFMKGISITGGEVKYSRILNAKFVLDYLKTCKSDIEVYPRDAEAPNSPLFFVDKDSEIEDVCTIMPIRLH
jgi:DNA polymerase III sliding clamp (beta) subunit (PCNA family)